MRDAQEQISKRIFTLLGLTLGRQDTPLVPDPPTRVEAIGKKRKPHLAFADTKIAISGATGAPTMDPCFPQFHDIIVAARKPGCYPA